MKLRHRYLFAAALLLVASSPVAALTCRSGMYSGVIEIRCSEPKMVTSQCRWSADVVTEGGGRGVRAGTFMVRKRSQDELVVQEAKLDGKRIVSGSVKMEGCAIGVPEPVEPRAAASASSAAPQPTAPPGKKTIPKPPVEPNQRR